MLENAHWHFTSCLLSGDTRLEHGIHCSNEYNSFMHSTKKTNKQKTQESVGGWITIYF